MTDAHDDDDAQRAWVLRETDHDDRDAFMAGWDAATRVKPERPTGFLPGMVYGSGGNLITARDEATVAALARALVRTGMYVDAGIDTSARLDKPRVYAMALLTDPELAEEGVHFVSLLDRLSKGTGG